MIQAILKGVLVRLGLVFLGLSPLLALEIGLRFLWTPGLSAAAPGVTWTAIDPFRREGAYLVTKASYLPAIRPARFEAKKPLDTCRIFCIGGSSTFGYPYEPALSWPSFLDRRFRDLYPDRLVEVINLGGNSYGSSRNLGVFRAILSYEPDIIVVAAGMNEFVEDSYRTTVESRGGIARHVRALRVYQALSLALPALRPATRVLPDGQQGTSGFFFSPVLSGDLYKPASPARRDATVRFAGNLDRMAELAEERGVTLLLCTFPSNLADWAPEADRSGPEDPALAPHWRTLYEKARSLERQRMPSDAAAVYAEAAALWEGNAEFCYRYGRLLLGLGRADQARRFLVRARDLDATPIRSTTDINDIIHAAARRHGVPLVDLEKEFEEASPLGVGGNALILDFVHPTPPGSALIARVVWQVVTGLGAPWSNYSPERAETYRRKELEITSKPAAISADLAFTWGLIFDRKGMTDQAIDMYRQAIGMGYPYPYPRQNLAIALLNRGRPEIALPLLESVVADYPGYKEPFPVLAEVQRRLGNTAAALNYFRRSIEEGFTGTDVFQRYALLLMDKGSPGEALAVLERGLTFHPGDCELESLRGFVLERTAGLEAARGAYAAILVRDRTCQPAWQNLGALQMRRGEWDAAAITFRRALSQEGASYPMHHLNLGYVYYRGLKNTAAAVAEFRAYCEAEPDCESRIPQELRHRLARTGASR